MFCAFCGQEIQEDSTFCKHCGAKLKAADAAASGGPSENDAAQPATGPGFAAPGAQQQFSQPPFIQPQLQQPQYASYQQKSKLAAGLLGILLGAFGVHNFYLGFNGKAIAQLLITILSCGILSFVSWIWGLIEGIIILTTQTADANGYPLKD